MKSFKKSPPPKKLIKGRGAYRARMPNPIEDSNIQPSSLTHPFPNQYSYPETNVMITNPDINLDLSNFNAQDVIPPPELDENQTQTQDVFESNQDFDKYIQIHYDNVLDNMSPKYKQPIRRNELTKSNQYLSVAEAIKLVESRQYTLVSLDNEFYERSTKKVIEIGISIYKPDYQRFALFPHITNIHFIIKENLRLRNGLFVPDSKMSNITGESYLISQKDVPKAMNSIFQKLGSKVIIVGHSVKGDLESFRHVNWCPPLLHVIDTSNLWSSLFDSVNIKTRLNYVLDKLSIPSAYLHNGVNDAYYTLVACLMLCSVDLRNNLRLKIKSREIIPEEEEKEEEDTEEQLQEQEQEQHQEPEEQQQIKEITLGELDFSSSITASYDSSKMSSNSDIVSDKSNSQSTETLALSATDIIKKSKRDQKKAQKKKSIDYGPTVRIRCGVSDESIERKYSFNNKKCMNPPSNYFFKPVNFSQAELDRKLSELTL